MARPGGAEMRKLMVLDKLPAYFLILCLTLFLYSFSKFWLFITVIFVAAVLSIAFYPLYNRIRSLLRGWERSASFYNLPDRYFDNRCSFDDFYYIDGR